MSQYSMYKELISSPLFQTGGVVIFIWENRAGWPVDAVSANLERLYGHTPDDYLSGRLSYADQIHPDDLHRVFEEVAQASEGDATSFSHQPYRYRNASGSYRWVNDSTAILRDASGNITHYIGYLTDITDQIDTQALLKEKEGRFEELFEIAPVGIALNAMDGSFVELNQALLDMVGYTYDEFVSLSYWDITPESYAPREQEQLDALTQTGKYGPYEKEYIHKDGHRIPVLLNGIITKDRFGEEYIWSIVQDVSKIKSAQEVLKKAQQIANIGHWKLDLNSNTLYWSDQTYRIFGLQPQEFEATYEAFVERIYPEDRDAVNKAYTDSVKTNTPYLITHRVIRPDGTIRYVEEQCEHTLDNSGEIIGSIGTILDITERVETEQSLKASEERFALAMKGANDGLWDWNLKSGHVYYSPRWLEMLGYEEGELPENIDTWQMLCHPDDVKATLDAVNAYLSGESNSFETEFRMRHKKGHLLPILSRAYLARDQKTGEPLRLVGTHVDMSSYKQLEEKLKQAKESAENANMAKSVFLANMSHEIRTPMNGILGFVDLLAKGENDPKRKQQFSLIKESGNSLLTILNDILDLSKIDSGKLGIEEHPFMTKEPFEHVALIYEGNEQSHGIDFTYHIDERLPQWCLGDIVRIKQVVLNLLSNAMKFTSKEGCVTLDVTFNPQMKSLLCSVSDTGIGIAPENLSKIFLAFEQEDGSTTRKFGGTGLGLAISSRLVEMMGGELRVESTLGKGSRFFFELPLKEVEAAADEESLSDTMEEPERAQLNGNVLLVEDNKTNQLLMELHLEELGLSYEIANDGIEAVECFKKGTYDLILMDENMPNMNGIEATREIRTIESSQGREPVPVIAVTANALSGDRERFLSVGMNDYIAKPFSEEEIEAVLRKYLAPSL